MFFFCNSFDFQEMNELMKNVNLDRLKYAKPTKIEREHVSFDISDEEEEPRQEYKKESRMERRYEMDAKIEENPMVRKTGEPEDVKELREQNNSIHLSIP